MAQDAVNDRKVRDRSDRKVQERSDRKVQERNGFLVLGLLVSLGIHAGLYAGLSRTEVPVRRAGPVELTVVTRTPIPEPVVETPPPTPPPAKVPIDLARMKTIKATKPVPPPPNTTAPLAKPTTEPPPVVSGLTPDSFSPTASISQPTFSAGNTLMAPPPEKPVPPAAVKPYSRPVALADVSTEPVLLDKPSPEAVFGSDYPPEAKIQEVEGTVTVRFVVDEQGKVWEIRAVRGPQLLRRPAEMLVARFRYRAATLNGQPVSVQWSVDIPFRITD
jgi:protein TonB